MKKFGLSLLTCSILLAGCNDSNEPSSPDEDTRLTSQLTTLESYGDIADATMWVSPNDNDKNLLIVTLEEDGFAIFNQQGEQVYHDNSREVLGADIRYGVSNGDNGTFDLLAVALPNDDAFAFYALNENTADTAENPLRSLGTLNIDMTPEALCLYKNVTTGDISVTGVSDEGNVLQYKLAYNGTEIVSAIKDVNDRDGDDNKEEPLAVRNFNVGGKLSACAVDDESATLYVAEQGLGIWAYGADAENVKDRRLVDSLAPLGQLEEVEGLDMIHQADGKGYLIAADQGAGFLLYEREGENAYAGQFNVDGIPEAKALAVSPDALWVANTEADEPVYEKVLMADLDNHLASQGIELADVISHRNLTAQDVKPVKAKGETDAVADDGDAADDPAFWLNEDTPSESLIIATNKQGGLMAYDLDGNLVQYLNEGKPNNVDIRNVTAQDGSIISLAAASNREHNTIVFYEIGGVGIELKGPISPLKAVGENVHNDAAELVSNVDEVYGLCMYKDNDTGIPYVFINGKDGQVEQWEISVTSDGVEGSIVRTLSVNSQPEGCVADDETGKLYLGEEDVAIWEFDAHPQGDTTATLFAEIDGKSLVADVEGLTLYDNGKSKYLIASSQGNNTYTMYNLNNNNSLVGVFAITGDDSRGVDGASDTDGIHAVPVDLGVDYPEGMFIAQDWYNIDESYEFKHQNFKMVSWEDIMVSMNEN
ncbi:phytase [Moritella sp. 24]|uniref:phytase n=1 Tax=Moritella sp. 24 TaxID=2746230 RepID=UPI001BABCCE0|nr:phytase [Moritella sp. 24]QUM76844.1 phytase [Moritella sp. 24]